MVIEIIEISFCIELRVKNVFESNLGVECVLFSTFLLWLQNDMKTLFDCKVLSLESKQFK